MFSCTTKPTKCDSSSFRAWFRKALFAFYHRIKIPLLHSLWQFSLCHTSSSSSSLHHPPELAIEHRASHILGKSALPPSYTPSPPYLPSVQQLSNVLRNETYQPSQNAEEGFLTWLLCNNWSFPLFPPLTCLPLLFLKRRDAYLDNNRAFKNTDNRCPL